MRISGRTATGVLAVLAVVVAAAAVAGVLLHPGRDRPPPRTSVDPAAMSAGPMRAVRSLVVLRSWDHARATAWAQGDAAALRRLYVDGSAAGRRDVAMLRRWTDRHLRVRGMSMQVLGVRLRARTERRIVLDVTDRLVGAYAVGGGRRIALPADNASTRRLEFRRVDGRWLLASVRPRTDRPRGAS